MGKIDRVDAKEAALKFLEHRMRTAYEVRTKLKNLGCDDKEIDETLRFLEDFHYVDDHHYALEYIEYGISKGRGQLRIKQELLKKGIDKETLEDAFVERAEAYGHAFDFKDSERERAFAQAKKLCDGLYDEDGRLPQKQQVKIGRRLVSLGYSSDTVYYVLGKLRRCE